MAFDHQRNFKISEVNDNQALCRHARSLLLLCIEFLIIDR